MNHPWTRRRFLKRTAHFGSMISFPAILTLSPNVASAEEDTKARAKHTFVFGSPYKTDSWLSSPHMHRELKANIERLSEGQIYVELVDNGVAGAGSELMAKVSRSLIDGALVSASNLSPIAPVLDLLNIPYWSAENQAYLNLITSSLWQERVVNTIAEKGIIKVMHPYVVGSRTASTTRLVDRAIRSPDDIKDMIFRVPSSRALKLFYELLEARTYHVDWGQVAQMSREGAIQAMDPSVIGLYNGPDDLNAQIGSITKIGSVQDSWLAVISQRWLSQLSPDLQEVMAEAGRQTFRQELLEYGRTETYCEEQFKAFGTQIYELTDVEQQKWIERCGHHRLEWRPLLQEVLGNASEFERFLEATQQNNGFTL